MLVTFHIDSVDKQSGSVSVNDIFATGCNTIPIFLPNEFRLWRSFWITSVKEEIRIKFQFKKGKKLHKFFKYPRCFIF